MLSSADLTTHSSKSSSTHKWLMLYSQPTTRFAMGSKTSSQSSDCIKRCTTPATARDTSSSQDQSCRQAAHCAPAPHSTYYKKEIYNCGAAFIRRLMKQLHSASARTTNIGRHIKKSPCRSDRQSCILVRHGWGFSIFKLPFIHLVKVPVQGLMYKTWQ